MSWTFERRPRLFFILILAFVNAIGYGIVAPVYPRLVETITHGGASQAGYYYTLLFTVYSATQFLFAPIIGRLSDRFGRRPLLLLPISALCLQYVIAASAHSVLVENFRDRCERQNEVFAPRPDRGRSIRPCRAREIMQWRRRRSQRRWEFHSTFLRAAV